MMRLSKCHWKLNVIINRCEESRTRYRMVLLYLALERPYLDC